LSGSNKKILLTIVFLAAVVSASYLRQETKTEDFGAGEFIRLHVVANSDSVSDQNLKRKVRDKIVQGVAPKFLETGNIALARDLARENLDLIRKIADYEIRNAGKEYPVRVELACFPFPTKHYGPFILPAGDYEAVRVVIGEGGGTNWWCVLFPPLCFVDLTRNAAAGNPPLDGDPAGAVLPGASTPLPFTSPWSGITGSTGDYDSCSDPGAGSGTRSVQDRVSGFDFSFGFNGGQDPDYCPAAPRPVPLPGPDTHLYSGQPAPDWETDTGVRVVFSFRLLEFFRGLKG